MLHEGGRASAERLAAWCGGRVCEGPEGWLVEVESPEGVYDCAAPGDWIDRSEEGLRVIRGGAKVSERHGRAAYAAYTEAVGGTTYDGRAMPTYDELGERQRKGWDAAGAAGPEHDPPHDTRPEAWRLFDPRYFPVPDELRERIRRERVSAPAEAVAEAWRKCEWHRLQEINTVGSMISVARQEDMEELIGYLGTDRVRYSMRENFVCRDYADVWAGAYVAFATCPAAVVMDFSGRHSYNAVPVMVPTEGGSREVRWVVVEPQADQVVAHLDPPHHYTGATGLIMLL